MRLRRRPRLAAVVVAAVALVPLACGDDEAADGGADTSAAAGEQSITVYSGRNLELVGPLLEQFTEETGIEVEVRDGDSAELAAQILTEGDASPADVFFSQDAGALGALSKAGLLAVLPEDTTALVPDAYRAADRTWVGTSGRARVIIYNPDLVATPPEDIDDLLDPQYRGKIGFAPSNASFQAFVTGLRILRGDDGAREWLEAFAAQQPVAYENNVGVRDAVDAGQVSVGLVNHYYLYELISEKGEENVTARNQFIGGGDPGGLVNVAGVGVVASTDDEEAAEELVAYLLSQAGQDYFAQQTYEYPLVAGVEAADALPSLSELDPPQIDLSELDSLQQTQELLAETGLLTQ
jgi:iron(III) transport system substrate-binding protein